VGHTDPDYYAMALIQNMIGSWNRLDSTNFSNSSFLTEVFAEGQWGGSKPRVNSYQAFTTSYHETGLFGTYVVAPTHVHHGLDYDLEYITKAIAQEPFKIAQRSALPTQLERAKAQLKAAILTHLDGTTPVCMNLGQSILTIGRTISPAELFMRIDAVSVTDIQRSCARFGDAAVVALGSTDAFSDYNQITRWSINGLH
jgi:mitochondrial-processing peptidase subunit beta